MISDVELAESFTQLVVGLINDALPTRLKLLRTAQGLDVEIEVLIDEIAGESRRGVVRKVPAQVRFLVIKGDGLEDVVSGFKEFGLTNVDRGRRGEVELLEVVTPVKGRRQLL